jgi:hypothetical protein
VHARLKPLRISAARSHAPLDPPHAPAVFEWPSHEQRPGDKLRNVHRAIMACPPAVGVSPLFTGDAMARTRVRNDRVALDECPQRRGHAAARTLRARTSPVESQCRVDVGETRTIDHDQAVEVDICQVADSDRPLVVDDVRKPVDRCRTATLVGIAQVVNDREGDQRCDERPDNSDRDPLHAAIIGLRSAASEKTFARLAQDGFAEPATQAAVAAVGDPQRARGAVALYPRQVHQPRQQVSAHCA